jgi:two-component system, chemotaxis family, chemotaxis protein CheY
MTRTIRWPFPSTASTLTQLWAHYPSVRVVDAERRHDTCLHQAHRLISMTAAHGRILVVDDDPPLRSVVAQALRFEGYTVDEAGNGLEGLDRLRTSPLPGLVLLDLRMPVLDGMGFLMQAHVQLDRIPIVIVSATPELANGVAAFGVQAQLLKPVDLPLLITLVDRLLSASAERDLPMSVPDRPTDR